MSRSTLRSWVPAVAVSAALIALPLFTCSGDGSLDPAALPPGVAVRKAPEQAPTDAVPFDYDGYRLVPVADYSVRGVVLGRESYRFGREAELSPLDFTLGWQVMSDPATLAQWEIRTASRWYRAKARLPGAEYEAIAPYLANTHLIPATDAIAKQLDAVKPGDVVRLDGWLVDVEALDGWRWETSRSRTDTGDGACELMYVRAMGEVDSLP